MSSREKNYYHAKYLHGGRGLTYLLYLVSLFGGFIKKRSRVIEILILIVIWMLSSFASGNADSGIYEGRYNFYQNYMGMSELGWQTLMIVFNTIGVEYQTFKCILIAIELVLLSHAIHRLSDEPGFVLAVYLLFPFCLDVVQMRFALADSIAFFAMSFLFQPIVYGEQCKHYKLTFTALILLASLFHFITIIYLVLLLVPRLGTVGSFLAVPLVSALVVLVVNWSGLAPIASAVGLGIKFEMVTSSSGGLSSIMRYSFNVVFCAAAWAFIFSLAPGSQDAGDTRRAALVVNWVIVAVVIPLLFLSVDFYRLEQGITLLNLCFLSHYLGKEARLGFSVRNVAIILLSGGLALANLFLYVLSNTNIDYVFWPLFKNNLLLLG